MMKRVYEDKMFEKFMKIFTRVFGVFLMFMLTSYLMYIIGIKNPIILFIVGFVVTYFSLNLTGKNGVKNAPCKYL